MNPLSSLMRGERHTRMPDDNVVDAYAEVGKEPQEDDGRKKVTELARAKPLEDEEQN